MSLDFAVLGGYNTEYKSHSWQELKFLVNSNSMFTAMNTLLFYFHCISSVSEDSEEWTADDDDPVFDSPNETSHM